jgi:preprotein translocase subunit SecF
VQVTNLSINQMLARTIMTSLTTLLVLAALIAIGGEVIYGFALALIVGVLVGTYSSIFVASSIALALGVSKEDLMKPVKEGEDASAQEEELHRIFLEEEAKREAREAEASAKK